MTAATDTDAGALGDAFLRDHLTGRELGTWALSPWAIGVISDRVESARPDLAIEFGSGTSTLCLAHVMRRARGDLRAPWVISFEQDSEHVEATRALLARAGLAEAAAVIHAPLKVVTTGAGPHAAYALDEPVVRDLVGDRDIGLVLVDGPSAEAGARVTTLPAIRSFLRRPAPFILDDAVRDGEIRAAAAWRREGLTQDDRYLIAETGLLLGTLTAP